MNELAEINIVGQKPSGWKPVVIRDIHGEKIWPKHLENFIGDFHDDVSIHFVGAALAYTLFVEAGFVPSTETEGVPDPDPAVIVAMEYNDYLLRFGSQKPSTGLKKYIFAVRFKAVVDKEDLARPELVREVYSQDEVHFHFFNRACLGNPPNAVNETDANSPSNNNGSDTSVTLSFQDRAIRFMYSNEIKVVFIMQEEGVEIAVTEKTDTAVAVKTYGLNILKFCEPLNCGPTMPADRWLKEIKLDGSKLSSTFKQEFVLGILDGINGITREFRGIQSLPPEVIIKIMKMCSTKTVTRLARTSHYLRSVTQDQGLWKYLVNRDYAMSARTESQRSEPLNQSDRSMKHRYRKLFDDEMKSRRLRQNEGLLDIHNVLFHV